MSDFFDALTDKHVAMIEAQPVFFVATAAPDARINLSPKGYDAFRVLSPTRVGYLDLGGSGNETSAHLLADGRITVMFCNFQQPALILRIYGKGKPVLPWESGWEEIAQHFTLLPAPGRSSISRWKACRPAAAGACLSCSSSANATRC